MDTSYALPLRVGKGLLPALAEEASRALPIDSD
jgi:hypothetical protein